MSQEQLLQLLIWTTTVLGVALVGMITWSAKSIISKVDKLTSLVRRELRMFDRRLVRVETKLNIPTPTDDLRDEDPE